MTITYTPSFGFWPFTWSPYMQCFWFQVGNWQVAL